MLGIDVKKKKNPPGIRGKDSKAAQANKNKTIDDTPDSEWKPMEAIKLDLSDNYRKQFTDEENYRAYKLFNIIDTSSTGAVTLREVRGIRGLIEHV